MSAIAAWVVLVVGLVSCLFWQPAPNRVVVPVIENPEQTVLQLYYRYGFPGPRSFFEYYSDKELLHRSSGELSAHFEIPGWQRLRAIRLDLGSTPRDYEVGPIVFGYEWAFRFYPLFTLEGDQILERWQPSDHVGSIEQSGDGFRVKAIGNDAFGVLPVYRSDWVDVLDARILWTLRLMRFLAFATVAGFVFLAGRLCQSGWLEKAGGSATPLWNKCWWLVGAAGVLCVGFVVYEPYLTFQKLYLFKDVATDSVDVFWPVFMHIADYFRTDGYPLWSFSIGTGQGIFAWIGDPFLLLIYMLPPLTVAFALGWLQLLKTIVAAVFFAGWLRLLGIGRLAALFWATGLAFSAHMVIRGNWTHYATEVVMVAFALFAFECFLKKRVWQLLPLAILFLVVRGVFHTYVWSILFLTYALVRLWLEAGLDFRWIGRKVLQLAGCYILGICLSAFFLLPNLFDLFSTPRVADSGSAMASFAKSGFFGINEPEEWLSSLFGLFAPDLLGRGNFYSGWRNYLEGPHLYVGTLAVLLLPQAFIGRGRKLQLTLALSLLAVLLYVFVPYVRYSLNAFSGIYYKTSSFWISLVVAGMAALALDNLLQRRILSRGLLLLTVIGCLVALRMLVRSEFVLEWLRVDESYRVYRQVIFLLVAYSLVLLLLGSARFRSGGIILLLVFFGWEIIQFAGGSAQDRLALRGDTMTTGGYYFDDTYDAVRMIEEVDDGFFRIEKGNVSVHLNDALGQGYRGLSSYYSFNAGGYLAFLGPDGFDVDYLVPGHTSSYVLGTGKRTVLATLLSTKYYIVRAWGDTSVPPGYSRWGGVGDAVIYSNDCFVPFGSVYFQQIDQQSVSDLPPKVRDLVALEAAIVPEAQLREGIPVLSGDDLERIQAVGTDSETEAWLDFYKGKTAELASERIEWTEISPNRMLGEVNLEGMGIAFISIPQGDGWIARVNGEERDFLSVHFGFRGLLLRPGLNEVELRYFPPMMKAGLVLSAIGVLVMISVWAFGSAVGRSQ